jgi:hypothetical protein
MSARPHDLPNFRDFCEAACVKLWGEPDSRNVRELRWNGAGLRRRMDHANSYNQCMTLKGYAHN